MEWVNRLQVTSLGLFVTLAGSGAVGALPILDQEYDPATPTVAAIIRTQSERAQTFAVGITGTLTSVQVKVNRSTGASSPLLLDVRTTSGGVPTEPDAGSNILASASIGAASVATAPSFLSVDLSSFGVTVTSGDVLAIVLRSAQTQPDGYQWNGTFTSGYAGGGSYLRNAVFTTWTARSDDFAFRTFVEPIPEPTSALLLACGLAVLAVRRRLTA